MVYRCAGGRLSLVDGVEGSLDGIFCGGGAVGGQHGLIGGLVALEQHGVALCLAGSHLVLERFQQFVARGRAVVLQFVVGAAAPTVAAVRCCARCLGGVVCALHADGQFAVVHKHITVGHGLEIFPDAGSSIGGVP